MALCWNRLTFWQSPHGDYDHMGEAINLVNNFKVEKVIFNCGEFNDLESELIKVLDEKKIKYYSCIKELGNYYSFIGSEYKIKIGDWNHYIELLLFNIEYNCYVVVELKVTEFKVEYISQVQKYMNYIDKNIKGVSNNNTIGILICKRENNFVIEYCSDERIAIREYELVWYN